MARQNTKKDTGEPGHFYFHEPIEQRISSTKPPPKSDPVNLFSYRERTNCRTVSIRNSSIAKCPTKIPYLLEEHPTVKEIADYHALQAVDGYGERAIVARRFMPLENTIASNQWGIILLAHHQAPGGIRKWAPYTVRWSLLGEIEPSWAEDLVIIHPALDKAQLTEILEAQGVTDA